MRSVTAAHDAAGNMTRAPRPGQESTPAETFLNVYDAWNPRKRGTRSAERGARSTRPQAGTDGALFSIRNPKSESRNRPDGLGRRIQKIVEGSPDVTYDYYYNEGRQVLEVWKDGDDDHPLEQYVWDGRYVHSNRGTQYQLFLDGPPGGR